MLSLQALQFLKSVYKTFFVINLYRSKTKTMLTLVNMFFVFLVLVQDSLISLYLEIVILIFIYLLIIFDLFTLFL